MKKGQVLIILAFLSTLIGYSQVRFANSLNHLIANNSSAFIDASSNPNYNNTTNIGKGFLFPRTDLTSFSAFGGLPYGVGSSYPNFYDGFLVYNSAKSGLVGVGTTSGQLVSGFYYYDNSNVSVSSGGLTPANKLIAGTWKRLGSYNIENNKEEITNLVIDNSNIYSFKGSFTASGSSTVIQLADLPLAIANGITTLYKVTIYDKTKKLFTNTVFSFDSANRQIVTGSPNVSVVYEAGNYDYILEYFK